MHTKVVASDTSQDHALITHISNKLYALFDPGDYYLTPNEALERYHERNEMLLPLLLDLDSTQVPLQDLFRNDTYLALLFIERYLVPEHGSAMGIIEAEPSPLMDGSGDSTPMQEWVRSVHSQFMGAISQNEPYALFKDNTAAMDLFRSLCSSFTISELIENFYHTCMTYFQEKGAHTPELQLSTEKVIAYLNTMVPYKITKYADIIISEMKELGLPSPLHELLMTFALFYDAISDIRTSFKREFDTLYAMSMSAFTSG